MDAVDSAESKRGGDLYCCRLAGIRGYCSGIRRTLDARPDVGGWEDPMLPLVKTVQFPHGRS